MRPLLLAVVALILASPCIRAEEFEPAKTHAVLVGVLEWKNGLGGFSKTNRKDQELRDLLVKRGTPAENIELLLDADATLVNIRKAMARALDRAPTGSTLIVYYAGHGWSMGNGDYGFANYDVQPGKNSTAWSLKELGSTLAHGFKGQRVLMWADCCYSGGFEIVVDALAAKKIAACHLTSASNANISTSNWTFTQAIIDGLRGEPLIDLNGDGKITLGELKCEVCEAMKHLEGQKHGFKANGLDDEFVMSKSNGPRPKGSEKFPVGSYVRARGRYGRVIAAEGESYTVQFYVYCDKIAQKFAAPDLIPSTRQIGSVAPMVAAPQLQSSNCDVEWRGTWYPAIVVKREPGRWYVHYVGYGNNWDEWVGQDRIRFHETWFRPVSLTGPRLWQPALTRE